MSNRHIVTRYWDSALSVVAGVCGAIWLTPAVISSVTTEVIAFFTIQAAVILPAMIFTAGLLRGQGLTLTEVDRYHSALRRQMSFWVTLLFFDLLAVTFLIVGKAAEWRWKVSVSGYGSNIAWVLFFCTTVVGTLAVLRMVPFVRGVMSLMELNGLLVRKAVQAEETKAVPESEPLSPAEPLDLPEGYGKILPHARRPRRPT
jgi:hypothetical protein